MRPTRKAMEEIQAALADAVQQRNELHVLACACVARAGGDVRLGGALLRGMRSVHRELTLSPDGDGYRVRLETEALDDDAPTHEAMQ
jgi:hypothetical protein